jgi:hypothetical protein
MWYIPIECDNTVTDPYVADMADLKGYNEWDVAYGRRIKNWDCSAFVQTDQPSDDGDPDDVLQNHLGIPIFSPGLQQGLSSGGIRGIQYLAIQVLRYDGSLIEGFAIANILHLVPCMDWARTEYRIKDKRPGEIRGYGFGKLVVVDRLWKGMIFFG